jgi:hypothetical protein
LEQNWDLGFCGGDWRATSARADNRLCVDSNQRT